MASSVRVGAFTTRENPRDNEQDEEHSNDNSPPAQQHRSRRSAAGSREIVHFLQSVTDRRLGETVPPGQSGAAHACKFDLGCIDARTKHLGPGSSRCSESTLDVKGLSPHRTWVSPHNDGIKTQAAQAPQRGRHQLRSGSLAPGGRVQVEAEYFASAGLLFGWPELREPDDMSPLFCHQEASEIEIAACEYLAPHRPPRRRRQPKDLGIKEVDVGNLPRRSVGFADLFCVCHSCPTHHNHIPGHLEMFLPGARLSKPSDGPRSATYRRLTGQAIAVA